MMDPLADLMKRRPTTSAAEILVAISQLASVFRDTDGDTCYATVEINGHRETWPVRSKGFRRWLGGRFYKASKPPGGQAVADALGVIEARAQFEGAAHPVHVRVAGTDERDLPGLGERRVGGRRGHRRRAGASSPTRR